MSKTTKQEIISIINDKSICLEDFWEAVGDYIISSENVFESMNDCIGAIFDIDVNDDSLIDNVMTGIFFGIEESTITKVAKKFGMSYHDFMDILYKGPEDHTLLLTRLDAVEPVPLPDSATYLLEGQKQLFDDKETI